MTLEKTLAAIDAATDGCQFCGAPLGESVSNDFCSETCQRLWHRNRVGAVEVPLEEIVEHLRLMRIYFESA